MDHLPIYATAVITLLGVAYPFIMQVISRLDDKYKSTRIVSLVDSEKEMKSFKILLYISLLAILLWSLKLPALFYTNIDIVDYIYFNSAALLGIVFTGLLIYNFVKLVNKLMIYMTLTKVTKYFIKKHRERELKEDYVYFEALVDILKLSIGEEEEENEKEVAYFIHDEFDEFRKNHEHSDEESIEYYQAHYKSLDRLLNYVVLRPEIRLKRTEHRIISGMWVWGEIGQYRISESTYAFHWRAMVLCVENQRDDMIMSYWQNADSYYRLILSYAEDKSVNEQKERFLEFNYALGGLLVYKKKYDLINRIFSFTNTLPASYPLLPQSIDDVFKWYIYFRDDYNKNLYRYSFPDIGGIDSDGIIRNWICKYISVLFLRQYSLIPHLIIDNYLGFPKIPETQGKKKNWLDNIAYFGKLLETTLNNDKLISSLGYSYLTKVWCQINNKDYPLDFISKLESVINKSIEECERSQKPDAENVKIFRNTSAKLMRDAFESFKDVNNPNKFDDNCNIAYVQGSRTIVDKSIFCSEQGSSHMNYHSFFGESLSNEYKRAIVQSFTMNAGRSYLLKVGDVFKAINTIVKNKDYIIVNCGVYLDYYISVLAIEGLTENSYKGIKIINLPNSIQGAAFVILKECDLPKIEHKKPLVIEDGKKPVDEELQIYAEVDDLHDNIALKEELSENPRYKDEDLDKKVLISIDYTVMIKWKKGINKIIIKAADPHFNKGLINDLRDIQQD